MVEPVADWPLMSEEEPVVPVAALGGVVEEPVVSVVEPVVPVVPVVELGGVEEEPVVSVVEPVVPVAPVL